MMSNMRLVVVLFMVPFCLFIVVNFMTFRFDVNASSLTVFKIDGAPSEARDLDDQYGLTPTNLVTTDVGLRGGQFKDEFRMEQDYFEHTDIMEYQDIHGKNQIGGISDVEVAHRNLSEQGSLFKGCYNDKRNDRGLPFYAGKVMHVFQCRQKCMSYGYRYFGRQFAGFQQYEECWCGDVQEIDDFTKHGEAENCECSHALTEHFKQCVYDVGYDSSSYLGCFYDKEDDRTLPIFIGRQMDLESCRKECFKLGSPIVGMHALGECWCGSGRFNKHGPAQDCQCDNIGAGMFCAYLINDFEGCFKDTPIDPALSYKVGTALSHRECSFECRRAGYHFIARKSNNDCYCGGSTTEDMSYSKHGLAKNCNCENPMDMEVNQSCVYRLYHANFKGCWKDTRDRALDYHAGNLMSYDQCYAACEELGYHYMSLQGKGHCRCGGIAVRDKSYERYGPDVGCKCNNEYVGDLKQCVYRVPKRKIEDCTEETVDCHWSLKGARVNLSPKNIPQQILISNKGISMNHNGGMLAIASTRLSTSGFTKIVEPIKIFQLVGRTQTWIQLNTGGVIGNMVSLSGDGRSIAVANVQTGKGRVKVLKKQGFNWNQVGEELYGGSSEISLANYGKRIAFGNHFSNDGFVRVFEFEDETASWKLMVNLAGAAGSWFGYSVSMSPNGRRLAVGAPKDNNKAGTVKIFQYDDQTSKFEQMGNEIHGDQKYHNLGFSVSLSAGGGIVAVGSGGVESVRVYKYDPKLNVWNQMGKDIVGDPDELFFGNSVSLSGNGEKVVIGSPMYNDYRGRAGVYQYDEAFDTWFPVGGYIVGETGDEAGWQVAMSADGDNVAVGVSQYGKGQASGVRVYGFK